MITQHHTCIQMTVTYKKLPNKGVHSMCCQMQLSHLQVREDSTQRKDQLQPPQMRTKTPKYDLLCFCLTEK